ncbi:hypothetical protein RGQ15_11865 [Paracoccus sp. MBLB3053]|uniref:TetR/AcrR family transcriptional regulator n=1 Tax=Paracoccus aurantius TaxID=3073814 RepID=A0ABU2HT91_9RHOB|nr:hypothetical protein [Paracoccus sp. MBLB3053]MDS9468263.1 hypothetical protein [Paracoccus sp. MBLB3053]
MPERGNIYQKLILAAQATLDATGALPDSLEDLAELSDLDVETVSQVFTSVDELRDGLIYQGVALLNDELRRGVIESGSDSPERQLRSLGRSYALWAEANPGLFRLIVEGLNQPIDEDSTLCRFTMAMRDLFERKLHEMRDRGLLPRETDIAPIMMVIHCIVRGANAIFLTRAFDPWTVNDPRPTSQIVCEMFDFFLDNLLAIKPVEPA